MAKIISNTDIQTMNTIMTEIGNLIVTTHS
jgi:hypothetical protein